MTISIPTLRIALQKSGRLKQDSLNYLAAQFNITCKAENVDFYKDTSQNIEFVFLREKDVLNFVMNGDADMGIIGENTFIESGYSDYPYQQLGFSKCRMSIAIPENQSYSGFNDLEGMRIATSYPKMLNTYLQVYNTDASTRLMAGSVEVAPSIGVADAVFDLVETGGTLKRNGLKEVDTLFESQAIAIFSKDYGQIDKEEMDLEILREIKRNFTTDTMQTPQCRLARSIY
jgi:ATP phosphoribosyltransferase